jgi:MoaA/NifB/PqqE/SkfB family radical SAM enzyme
MHFEALIDRKREAAKVRPQLVSAMIELTYGCNLRCVHCYNPTHEARGELSTAEVEKILSQLAVEGCLWVSFTGGELFTRRDAGALVRYAKSLGMVVSLITNATLITPALADEIQEMNPYQLEISIYGATADVYESVTRVRGSFSHFVRGVELLLERKVDFILKPVLMTLNVHEKDAMIAFAQTRGLRWRASTEIHPRVDGNLEPLAYRLSPERSFEIWRELSGEAIRRNQASEASMESGCGSAGQLFDCLCGKSSAAVTPYGELNLCVSLQEPRFDLKRATLQEGWQQLVEHVENARPGPAYECQQCSLAT